MIAAHGNPEICKIAISSLHRKLWSSCRCSSLKPSVGTQKHPIACDRNAESVTVSQPTHVKSHKMSTSWQHTCQGNASPSLNSLSCGNKQVTGILWILPKHHGIHQLRESQDYGRSEPWKNMDSWPTLKQSNSLRIFNNDDATSATLETPTSPIYSCLKP